MSGNKESLVFNTTFFCIGRVDGFVLFYYLKFELVYLQNVCFLRIIIRKILPFKIGLKIPKTIIVSI